MYRGNPVDVSKEVFDCLTAGSSCSHISHVMYLQEEFINNCNVLFVLHSVRFSDELVKTRENELTDNKITKYTTVKMVVVINLNIELFFCSSLFQES